jgi:hypothetical protein
MTQQLRPLSGGDANGSPISLLAAGTIVHTVPAVAANRVGPVMDQINLFLSNSTGADIVATVGIAGNDFDVTVPMNDSVQALFTQPVLGTIATAVSVTVSHTGANGALVAWGNFTRA